MNRGPQSLLRKAMLPLATGAVALGALLGLPAIKALAQDWKVVPRAIKPPLARMAIVRPEFVNPTAQRLVGIAEQAMADPALAQRIFDSPDAVAAQFGLDEHEQQVLRHMNREQFEVAQGDAARLTQARLAEAGANALPPGATDARQIAVGMVVGRAILAAVGRSYLEAANAHACCPWSKAIEIGVNAKRVLYNEAFGAPAMNLPRLRTIQPAPAIEPR